MRYKTLGAEKKKYPRRTYDWICQNVDPVKLDKLLELHLRMEDICDLWDVGPDAFKRYFKKRHGQTFAQYSDKKRVNGRITLMQKYWQKVKQGNMTAIIFGLKNIMNWSDNDQQTPPIQAGFQFYTG